MRTRSLPRAARYALLFVFTLALVAIGATSASAQTPPFDRTIIVGGSGTPIVNGNNLQAALATADAAATPTDPWLVKVEPGLFDLGTGTIAMRDFVDIEGSGRNATFITTVGNGFTLVPTTLDVAAGIDSEIRNLTLQCVSDTVCAAIVNASTELKATVLNLEVEATQTGYGILSTAGNPRFSAIFPRVTAEEGTAVGMEVRAGGPIVNEMFIFAQSFGGETYGWNFTGTAVSPIIEQVSAVLLGSASETYGFRSTGAAPRITNARVTISTSGRAWGLLAEQPPFTLTLNEVDVQESTFDVTADKAIGISSNAVTVNVQSTRVDASDSAGVGIAADGSNNAVLFFDQTVLSASESVTLASSSRFNGGATQLDGARSFAAGTTAACAASYDGAFAPVAANCL